MALPLVFIVPTYVYDGTDVALNCQLQNVENATRILIKKHDHSEANNHLLPLPGQDYSLVRVFL